MHAAKILRENVVKENRRQGVNTIFFPEIKQL